MTTLHRKTSMGVPVQIEIDEWTISAYREEAAQVLKREFRADGSVNIEVEPELSRHLTSEPVGGGVRTRFRELPGNVMELAEPHVPTSCETAPPRNLCTDGRRMDRRSCRNHPVFLTVTPHRRASADRLDRAALPSRPCRRGPAESLALPTSFAS